MLRAWLRRHIPLVISVTSGIIVAALVLTAAIVSTGYTAQRVDLGDGTVWVANNQQQAIGRANPAVLELNTVVATTGSDLDVVQAGEKVLLVDHTGNKVDIVDPATSKVTDSVPLPPAQPQVFLAGTSIVVFEAGTGKLWIVPGSDFPTFDAESDPSLSLGAGAVVSVDSAGLLFAYSPSTRQVLRVDAAVSDDVSGTEPVSIPTGGELSITSVAGSWAVLDADSNTVYLAGRTVKLAPLIGAGTGTVLQWASADGDRVLVAYSAGLISIPLSGAAAVALVDGKAGTPARPLTLAGCEYAAWSGGESWRRCQSDGGGGTSLALTGMTTTAALSFFSNGDQAVLNDRRSGDTWAVQRDGESIDNWDDLIVKDDQPPQQQQNDEDVPPQVDKVQEPPVAVNDSFGARPGRASVLPVLLNDFDPNGDVLVVSSVTPIDENIGHLDLINQQQQIQITLSGSASGSVSFNYTITDGRGGSATATVTVAIRTPNENSPPVQVRSTKAVVQAGGRTTISVLGDWVDPDGDAFYLTSATVAAPDTVSYKPGGTVVFSDSGGASDLVIVNLVVSDGTAESSGTLSVTVKPAGQVPIVADPFVVLASAGQQLTISPLDHVRGGTGTVRLNSVPAKPDATITPSYETGTFTFESDQIRSHYLEYVVTDGTLTVTGVVRVDVSAPPDPNTKPITVPKTVFVTAQNTERIDVAGTDVDPAGGVLLVTSVTNLPSDSGVRAEILDQRTVRVSLTSPLEGPVTFNYRITNGLAEAQGVITVIEIPTPQHIQAPIANDDSVTVRVGEAIDIPVLDNDEHPDGLDLTLQPKLAQDLPDGSGLLFASGRVLRYLAPDKTGNFTAAYTVTGPDGQAATALVKIAVREVDPATNNPPVPATVTARVIAGETVRVRIPLTGIDPDGDSVQLVGQATNPQKGAVTSVESDTIVYQAGDYSAGTDTFTYTVIDLLGARATGTVRVGISPRLDGARNPVANVDAVTVRPGFTVSVQALANDSDPDGSPLTIVSAVPADPATGLTAKVVGTDVVDITPPRAPGTYAVIYQIENDRGGTSENFIRVTVSADAPLAYPVATDSVLTLSDVLDRDRVTVDVLANVFFADGSSRSLGLSVYSGYGSVARVTSDKKIEVTIGDRSQIIPFKVTHPQDPSIVSYAFIRVPGFDDALPQLDRRAPALRVTSEDQLVINLNDYVIAVGGKRVRLTDTSTVQATHSNGANLVVDSDTLVYTSADKYFGPASISFEVTDGTSATDPAGRTAILVLPITVLPRQNQPPSFTGAVIEFEPGQEKEIDLLKLTTYAKDDLDQLVYSALDPLPEGFEYAINGTKLTLRAKEDAVKGSVATLSVGVRDNLNDGAAGRIELHVVASTRPLLIAAADSAVAPRGGTTSVDVLQNDQATNPFPGKPLTVLAIRGLDGASVPAGITIVPSADKSKLSVSVAASAAPVDVTLQYQVADATNDPTRYVWGNITISVEDRPDPVSNLAPTGFADRQITMRWNAGSFNNSPITGYKVTTTQGSTVVGTTNCSGTTCVIPTPGNGPANAVTVSVVATNAIGDSDPVTLPDKVWSDIIPPAPTALSSSPVDHGLVISWSQVTTPAGGSAVDRYHLVVGGNSGDVSPSACGGGTCSVNTTSLGWSLDNGVAVTYTVSARNGALTALSVWNTSEPASGVPAGPPLVVGAASATVQSDTSIGFSWPATFGANGRAITQYTAAAYTGAAPTCSANGTVTANSAVLSVTGTSTSTVFSGLSANATYTLVVFAYNGQGCTASGAVVAHTPPPVITDIAFSGPSLHGSVYDFVLTGGTAGGTALGSADSIYYRLNGGSENGPVSLGGFLAADNTQFGQDVSITARACRTYDGVPVCQTVASNPQSLGVPVNPQLSGLTFVNDNNVLSPGSGTFYWLGLPTGPGYTDVQYACGTSAGGSFSSASGVSQCHVDSGLLGEAYVTIRVIANGGKTYDLSYRASQL